MRSKNIYSRSNPITIRKSEVTIKYTNGGEFIHYVRNLGPVDYVGFYYELKNGRKFIGADYTNTRRTPLHSRPKSSFDDKNKMYYYLTAQSYDRYVYPSYFYPQPNPEDYKKGFIKRIFVQKVNNLQNIIEIDKAQKLQYNTNNSQGINGYLWKIVTLNWTISGPIEQVRKSNLRTLNTVNKTMIGIKNYLGDLDEFHESLPIIRQQGTLIKSGLYTEGGEYILSNGQEYIGSYHIHPQKGAMVGSQHSDEPHSYLFRIEENNSSY
jgi:hypothetical protein